MIAENRIKNISQLTWKDITLDLIQEWKRIKSWAKQDESEKDGGIG